MVSLNGGYSVARRLEADGRVTRACERRWTLGHDEGGYVPVLKCFVKIAVRR